MRNDDASSFLDHYRALRILDYDPFISIDIDGVGEALEPGSSVGVTARASGGGVVTFEADVRLDTAMEAEYYRNGGILQTVLRQMLA
jgi:aconitate hydratase